ncbi:MAG: glutaredoxin 3 [Candidatus Polarisedimenticolaceae bacterium]|nr:glutaredoxin 3 [Candidatus Polarisedimenticolaceae bacterium]
MPDIIVYSTTYCPYCVRAKQLLERKDVEYREIMVDHDPNLMQEMMERSQRRTVPQIFINEQSIGGYDDLAHLDAKGELDGLLGLAG